MQKAVPLRLAQSRLHNRMLLPLTLECDGHVLVVVHVGEEGDPTVHRHLRTAAVRRSRSQARLAAGGDNPLLGRRVAELLVVVAPVRAAVRLAVPEVNALRTGDVQADMAALAFAARGLARAGRDGGELLAGVGPLHLRGAGASLERRRLGAAERVQAQAGAFVLKREGRAGDGAAAARLPLLAAIQLAHVRRIIVGAVPEAHRRSLVLTPTAGGLERFRVGDGADAHQILADLGHRVEEA